eukprot:7900857-Alexandrium_andersonii.AAC.1
MELGHEQHGAQKTSTSRRSSGALPQDSKSQVPGASRRHSGSVKWTDPGSRPRGDPRGLWPSSLL